MMLLAFMVTLHQTEQEMVDCCGMRYCVFFFTYSSTVIVVGLEGEGRPTLDLVFQLWSDLTTGILITVRV